MKQFRKKQVNEHSLRRISTKTTTTKRKKRLKLSTKKPFITTSTRYCKSCKKRRKFNYDKNLGHSICVWCKGRNIPYFNKKGNSTALFLFVITILILAFIMAVPPNVRLLFLT